MLAGGVTTRKAYAFLINKSIFHPALKKLYNNNIFTLTAFLKEI